MAIQKFSIIKILIICKNSNYLLRHAVCGRNSWRYNGDNPICKSDLPPPFIMCPPDQIKALPPGSASVYVMFPQPKTNVDWFR